MRSLVMGSLVLAVWLAGCSAIAPVGSNKARFSYSRADDAGQVVISPVLPDGAASEKIAFSLAVPEDTLKKLELESAELQGQATDCLESSPEDATCFALDVSTLPAGFYPIDVYVGGAETPDASETILVPTEPAAADDAASEAEE